jgi:histone-binding protein RBBP4
MVANVTLPTVGTAAGGANANKSCPTHNAINVTQLIALDSEVNRARACPQLPSLVACQTGGADFLLFDVNKHPARPLRGGVCIPELRLRGHKKQGYGVSWSPLHTGMLVSGADDKMICVYDISATAAMQSAGGVSAELRALSGAGESGSDLEPLLQLSGHADVVEDVCCSPHSHHEFLSCSDDGTIRMWVRFYFVISITMPSAPLP